MVCLSRFIPSLKSHLGPQLRILPSYSDQNTVLTILQDTSGLSPQFSAIDLILANKTTEDILLELGLSNFNGTSSDLIDILYNLPAGWDPVLAQEITSVSREEVLNLTYGETILFYVTGYLPEQYESKTDSDHVQNYSAQEIVYLADFYSHNIVDGNRIYHTLHSPYKFVASVTDRNLETELLKLRSHFDLTRYEALQTRARLQIVRTWKNDILINELNPNFELHWDLKGSVLSKKQFSHDRMVAYYKPEYKELITYFETHRVVEIWNYKTFHYETGSETLEDPKERIGVWTVAKLNTYQPWNLEDIRLIDYEVQRLLTSATIKELDNGIILVQDSEHLTYGAKSRGLQFFIDTKRRGYRSVVASGTTHGYGQAAIAFACKQAGLKCVLFVNTEIPRTLMTQMAIDLGATVNEMKETLRNEELNNLAQNYAQTHPGTLYLPSGLYHKGYIEALSANMKFIGEKYGLHPKRIWIVAGTGIAALAVGLAFPEAELQIVQVGRPVWTDILDQAHIKYHLYTYTETRFLESALELPPYTALANFDAKVWHFVKQYGEPGDLIWNIK